MRGLFRSILALLALGLSLFGCGGSRSPSPNEGPDNSPFHATFRVPGMT
jgi:hypothetical protein